MSTRLQTLALRLGRSPVFSTLSVEARTELARAGVRRSLRRRQILFRRGERSDALALVLTGRLDVTRITERGEPVILRSLTPDALVGLSTAAGAEHSADVVAGESSQVLLIPGAALRGLLASRPEAALRAIVHLAGLLADLTDEVEEQRTHDLEERIRRRLARIGRGLREVRITHDELAAQVGATRANVSRALARLEARGLLRRRRGRIELSGLG